MSRLIDADKLYQSFLDLQGKLKNRYIDIDDIYHVIKDADTVQPNVIMCKNCNEWHRGKNKYNDCCYSDEGFCCVHSIITGENYYCGDAERR